MRCFTAGSFGRRRSNRGRRLLEVTTTEQPVSLMACRMPSSPRLVYTVQTAMFWLKYLYDVYFVPQTEGLSKKL